MPLLRIHVHVFEGRSGLGRPIEVVVGQLALPVRIVKRGACSILKAQVSLCQLITPFGLGIGREVLLDLRVEALFIVVVLIPLYLTQLYLVLPGYHILNPFSLLLLKHLSLLHL